MNVKGNVWGEMDHYLLLLLDIVYIDPLQDTFNKGTRKSFNCIENPLFVRNRLIFSALWIFNILYIILFFELKKLISS